MCRFKSGIILKSRVVLAPDENESHFDLLKSMNIEDEYINATKNFVKVEFIPPMVIKQQILVFGSIV